MRFLFATAVLIAAAGCQSPPAPSACVPGETQICVGLDRCDGVQVCVLEGTGWSVCRCSRGDAGAPPDGSTGLDAGPAPVGECTVEPSELPLRSECLPRCTAETAAVWAACTSYNCERAAFANDSTPPIVVHYGDYDYPIDCLGCFDWQYGSCTWEMCPTEYQVCAVCEDGCADLNGPCGDETAALVACADARQAALDACIERRLAECLP